MSPYQYAANNLMNNIDINGDSIWSTRVGNVVTYHISGWLINFSNSDLDMEQVRKHIKSYFESVFKSDNVDGIDYKFSFEMEVAENMNQASESDHLLVFAEDCYYHKMDAKTGDITKLSAKGFAERLGKVAFIDEDNYYKSLEGITGMIG
jgi:hypothetical protein